MYRPRWTAALLLLTISWAVATSAPLVDDDPKVDDDVTSSSGSLSGEVVRKGNGWTWYCYGSCHAPAEQRTEPTPGLCVPRAS
jgi:hypothetical protein